MYNKVILIEKFLHCEWKRISLSQGGGDKAKLNLTIHEIYMLYVLLTVLSMRWIRSRRLGLYLECIGG